MLDEVFEGTGYTAFHLVDGTAPQRAGGGHAGLLNLGRRTGFGRARGPSAVAKPDTPSGLDRLIVIHAAGAAAE